ncbi:MAG: YfbK domain-containing protein [Roseibacillus sp.]
MEEGLDFQFAAGVALFGEKLRGSDKIDDAAWELVAELAQNGSAHDPHGYRAEFRELVSLAGKLPVEPKPVPVPAQPGVEAPPASR